METKAIEKRKIIDYIYNNFNIDTTALRLIEALCDFVIYKQISVDDFCKILNNAFIDITSQELKENNLI